MMKTLITLTLGCGIFWSHAASADTIEVLGKGKASAIPDYVRVDVTVISECYRDLTDARNATNYAARKVVELFETIIDPNNEQDAIHASGGATSRSFGHYIPGTNERICVGTFEKRSVVTLLTSDIENFEEQFAAIEDLVFSDELIRLSEAIDQPTTYVELATPKAMLGHVSLSSLEQDALYRALEDAKAKFKALTDGLCAVTSYRIASAAEPVVSRDAPPPYSGPRDAAVGGSVNEPAPIAFADIDVNKELEVRFEYEEAVCFVDKGRMLTH